MLKFRKYSVECPSCRQAMDIRPPRSIEMERNGLTERCPHCRRWLVLSLWRVGPWRVPEARLIGA